MMSFTIEHDLVDPMYYEGTMYNTGDNVEFVDLICASKYNMKEQSVTLPGYVMTMEASVDGRLGGGSTKLRSNAYQKMSEWEGMYATVTDEQRDGIFWDVRNTSRDSLKIDADGNLYHTLGFGNYYYYTDRGFVENPGIDGSTYKGHELTTEEKEQIEEKYGIKFLTMDYVTQKVINFNHIDGSEIDHLYLQTSGETNEGLTVLGVNATTKSLGIDKLSVETENLATAGIDLVGEAIMRVNAMRSYFGAIQNRLEHAVKNTDNTVENTTAAESRIRDTDMAGEMVKISKDRILAQAGEAVLSKANSNQQYVLSLLQ
ncbi:hypothetical protein FXF36_06205 [Pseudobutyrivibrio xylanivorans]|uniref:Flagellin C-terminal domain-containing protein n=2 Tax=Pseudobutyrivibrio xylanivorans TaxID=185007 RepID=A0A5P6VVP7_PSEXY|nr:hypothetical protein FXF36_06205 [Pseudobutyrivibrio xylanivorans]